MQIWQFARSDQTSEFHIFAPPNATPSSLPPGADAPLRPPFPPPLADSELDFPSLCSAASACELVWCLDFVVMTMYVTDALILTTLLGCAYQNSSMLTSVAPPYRNQLQGLVRVVVVFTHRQHTVPPFHQPIHHSVCRLTAVVYFRSQHPSFEILCR